MQFDAVADLCMVKKYDESRDQTVYQTTYIAYK